LIAALSSDSYTSKKLTIAIIVLAVIAMWFLTNPDSPNPKPDLPSEPIDQTASLGKSYRLVRVVDGDTIKIRVKDKTEPVRLLRINTPERGVAGYEQATQALRELLITPKVEIVFEKPQSEQRDRYDRILAYVFVKAKNVNVEMVRGGWSRFWTRYGEGRFSSSFVLAQQTANKFNRGLWTNGRWNGKTISGGF
jgi:endonuclease YncB( thermonuclease family)